MRVGGRRHAIGANRRGEAEGSARAELAGGAQRHMVLAGAIVGRSRTAEIGQSGLVGSGPRQRHAATVTALIHRGLSGVESGRILQSIPRNIGHLKQTQLLALIDVCGTGQAELHQRGGTGTAGAEFAVLRVGGAVAQQPVVWQLVIRRALDLRQTIAGGAARHVMIVHDPRGGGAAGFGRRLEPGGDGLAELVGIPVGLREVEVIYRSKACLIQRDGEMEESKQQLIDKLLTRIQGVIQARESKYIMMHAPTERLDEVIALLPGAERPTILPLAGDQQRVAMHMVSSETLFWETMEKLKALGASSILVLPIEKMME